MYYSIFYWLIWLVFMPVVIKYASLGKELLGVVIYAFLGLALYFTLPVITDISLSKIERKRFELRKTRECERKRFLKEQQLRKKYRYIKLKIKEDIINSNIDKNDKVFLLEAIHGCAPDEARRLVEAAEIQKDKK